MSYTYRSRATENTGFTCNLECRRCTAPARSTNTQCRRNTCKYLPYCHSHLRSVLNLRVGPSTLNIMHNGVRMDGVFATADLVVGTRIPYDGDVMTNTQLDNWYGRTRFNLAPYAENVTHNRNVDAACKRFIGSKVNDVSSEEHLTPAYYQNRHRYNAAFRKVNNNTVFVETIVPINAGDEIFVSYGRAYWLAHRNITSINHTRKTRNPTRQ